MQQNKQQLQKKNQVNNIKRISDVKRNISFDVFQFGFEPKTGSHMITR